MGRTLFAALTLSVLATVAATIPAPAAGSGNAYQFAFTSIDGEPLPLSRYRGKVLLVVNTASFCGYTPQYRGLEVLWETYRDRGLVVIGVPSDDFGHEEPGSAAEIKGFCRGQYNVTFPLTKKYAVRGRDAHPFYVWARQFPGPKDAPMWNFYKYLIGRDGEIAAQFPTATAPDAKPVIAAIEAALAKPSS
jgi:glutathione peroxidase